MIGLLNGHVESVDADAALISVGGSGGMRCACPPPTCRPCTPGRRPACSPRSTCPQDAVTLYGFLTQASKRMFLQLQKVSGIGPKVALSLLSTLPPDRLARAVADGDAAALAKAPGLGKKGAQKIILELKGSIDLSQIEGSAAPAAAQVDTGSMQVVEGLMSLGVEAAGRRARRA